MTLRRTVSPISYPQSLSGAQLHDRVDERTIHWNPSNELERPEEKSRYLTLIICLEVTYQHSQVIQLWSFREFCPGPRRIRESVSIEKNDMLFCAQGRVSCNETLLGNTTDYSMSSSCLEIILYGLSRGLSVVVKDKEGLLYPPV